MRRRGQSEPQELLRSARKARMLNKDYREMLQCLLEEKVKFLLVGAYAVAVHGFPRATKDIECFKLAIAHAESTSLPTSAVSNSSALMPIEKTSFWKDWKFLSYPYPT